MGDLHCCPNTNGTCSKIKSVIKQRIDELEEEKKEEEEKHALWTKDFNKEETGYGISLTTRLFGYSRFKRIVFQARGFLLLEDSLRLRSRGDIFLQIKI